MKSREVRFARRPEGGVGAHTFEVVETAIREPQEGELIIRNLWMSVDPYMRLPLTDMAGSSANRKIGETMLGDAVGVVVQSRNPSFPEGAIVVSRKGWREAYVSSGEDLEQVDPNVRSLSWYVGILGLIGITAFAGVEFVLQPQAGETIYVSAAAGAVGQVACQLAKRRGCRVLATAGSDEKVDWLMSEIGVDAAANYRTADVEAFLRQQCPQGLDIYFDNVGGRTLDAALRSLRVFGRAGVCGAISQYNSDNYRRGPEDFFSIIEKGLTVTGFSSRIYRARSGEILPPLRAMLESGELKWTETEVNGIENAPAAFASLFDGSNLGKVVVRLSEL